MRSGVYMLLMAALLMVTACVDEKAEEPPMKVNKLDLSSFSADKPQQPIHLLFIHHSTGGQLLADRGQDIGKDCIYTSHPNGGGLRRLLEENNYIVHEASYGSLVGDKTDICHWNAKFRDHMDKVLTCKHQDEFLTNGTKNRIVLLKSCFPNNNIESDGKEPGDPDSCMMTTANFKASYNALLKYFEKEPDTLFIVLTAPPLVKPRGLIKERIKVLLGRDDTVQETGFRARSFNNWLMDSQYGWLKDYQPKNVMVFDFYDILTGNGKSNWLVYPTRGGQDSHPSTEGSSEAGREFIPFINRAVHRMGL